MVVLWLASWKRQHDKTLTEIRKVAGDIYLLCNSHMEEQLRINAALTKRMAGFTGLEEDVLEASKSQAAYEAHEKRQDVVDAAVLKQGG
jgi:hypothetical protein